MLSTITPKCYLHAVNESHLFTLYIKEICIDSERGLCVTENQYQETTSRSENV